MRKIIIFMMLCCSLLSMSVVYADPLVITSTFGPRINPITGEYSFHTGIDIAKNYGDPIPALFSGEVVFAGPKGGYGNAIILHHADNTYTLYGHCSQLFVVAGQKVKAGEVIGLIGSTGNSTGPHLHLEYWVPTQNGGWEYADPLILWSQK
ncbi:peptidase m23 [Lucifera butyrica]|uniref:Peptidase m23 n=1 Tax=Lucifera butyrica TaxID=1351585 RepID=A0A498RBV7_9FIRM|nr:M23 family metallopeptidase [Lucifera butyrica]VBB08465.1 peptidase m23 [Lucifera butyrica]